MSEDSFCALEDSEDTVIVDNEELSTILNNYQKVVPTAKPSTSKRTETNIYSLDDFSDAESICEPIETRVKNPSEASTASKPNWQSNFSAAEFLEDSGDSDVILTQISQAEASRKQTFSQELESLIGESSKKSYLSYDNSLDQELEKNGGCNLNEKLEKWKNSFRPNLEDTDSDVGSCRDPKRTRSPELGGCNLIEKLEKWNNSFRPNLPDSNSNFGSCSDPKPTHLSPEIEEPKAKKLRKQTSSEKDAKKAEAELAKARKREQKELEKENRKQVKNALKNVKYFTHAERILDVTVNIDEDISNKAFGKVLETGLTCGYYKYLVSKQIRPNLISWTKNTTVESSSNANEPEKQFMLIVEVAEFIEHIANNSLIDYIQSFLSLPQIEHLTIAIIGLQSYYKYLNDHKNRDFKNAVADVQHRSIASNVPFKYLSKIPKKEIEKKLVELQFFCKRTYVRLLEMIEELVSFVIECTKAVVNRAERLEKWNTLQLENEYFAANNRDCVPVDKDGNGLMRLWNQALIMFPSASLETAEAITSVYPTLHSLMQAYKCCDDEETKELLLQNIPVRRRANPLDRPRKLGPELSKKVYKFFFSKHNISIIT